MHEILFDVHIEHLSEIKQDNILHQLATMIQEDDAVKHEE